MGKNEQRGSRILARILPSYSFAGLAIVLLAFFERVSTIDSRSLWLDEGLNYWTAFAPLSLLMTSVVDGLQHPPLFSVLLHFWMILGKNEFILRYLSLSFSLLSVVGIISLGTTLFDRRIGLIAGSLMALSPPQIRYAQEVGQYSLLGTCLVFSLFALEHALREQDRRWFWVWGGSIVLSLYSYYGTFVPLLALALVTTVELAAHRKWSSLRQLTFAGLASGTAILPLVAVFLPGQLYRGPTAQAFQLSIGDPARELEQFVEGSRGVISFQISNGLNFPWQGVPEWSVWIPAIGSIGFALYGLRDRRKNMRPLLWLSLTWLVYYAVSKLNLLPFFARYSLIIAPLFFLAIAFGIGSAFRASPILGGAILLWIFGLCLFSYPPPQEDNRGAALFLEAHRGDGDITYVYYAAAPAFRYYLVQRGLDSVPVPPSSSWYNACWAGASSCAHGTTNVYYGIWLRALQPAAKVESIGNTFGGWPRRFWIIFSHARLGEEGQILGPLGEKYSVSISNIRQDASVYLLEEK